METLRHTRTTCPVCLREVPGTVTLRDGIAWLERECPDHGPRAALLSRHPEYFRDIHEFYFDLMRESFPQHDFILRTTDRCNLECPICLASANERALPDLPQEQLIEFVRTRKRNKIDLMGAEPTVREDLPELIRIVADSGNYAALHTNGIRLAELDYLRTLVDAGLSEVHFQLDGFDDGVYRSIRGKELLDNKMQALENLKKLDVATDLKCTICNDINTDQLGAVFDYAVKNDFVREVFFLGCRWLGRQREGEDDALLAPDELIDFLDEQTGGRINRDDVRVFQKIYFAMLHLSRLRKCFYNQHYLVVRENGGYRTAFEVIKKDGLDEKLEAYRRGTNGGKRRWLPALALGFRLLPHFTNLRALRLLWDGVVLKFLLSLGFAIKRVPRRNLLVGYISACDPLIWDEAVARNCGKGDIAVDIGSHDSGATANVERDRRIYAEAEWEMREKPDD